MHHHSLRRVGLAGPVRSEQILVETRLGLQRRLQRQHQHQHSGNNTTAKHITTTTTTILVCFYQSAELSYPLVLLHAQLTLSPLEMAYYRATVK